MTVVRRWVAAGVSLAAVVVVVGALLAGAMARRYAPLDLTLVPRPAPAYHPSAPLSDTWPILRGHGVSVAVPPGLRYPRLATTPGTLVFTDRWQTTWLSISPRHSASRWAAQWYRHCLYARHDPLGLLGKALLVPPMGTPTPEFVDQQVGAWQAYLYVTPSRVAADLFDGRHHVTVVYAGRREAAVDVDLVRAILASLRVTP